METTNGRAFGRARHSVTAVPGCWMPLGRAARECRPAPTFHQRGFNIVGRLCQPPWRFTETPYNRHIIHHWRDCHPALLSRLWRLNRATPFPVPSRASEFHR